MPLDCRKLPPKTYHRCDSLKQKKKQQRIASTVKICYFILVNTTQCSWQPIIEALSQRPCRSFPDNSRCNDQILPFFKATIYFGHHSRRLSRVMRHFRAWKDGAPLLTSTLSTFHTSPEGHCLFYFLVNPFIWCSAFIHQVIESTREKVLLRLKSAHQTSHQIGNTLNISIRA